MRTRPDAFFLNTGYNPRMTNLVTAVCVVVVVEVPVFLWLVMGGVI